MSYLLFLLTILKCKNPKQRRIPKVAKTHMTIKCPSESAISLSRYVTPSIGDLPSACGKIKERKMIMNGRFKQHANFS